MIYVMLANGFEEIEALAFVDILRRAEIDVKTVSINKDTNEVCGSHNISINADINISQVDEIGDGIVLPGGLPGTYNLRDDENVTKLILSHYNNNKYIGAICAAPSVFGGLGLLVGKEATSYPSFTDTLTGAKLSQEKVVCDGNVITSRGAGTAHDFAFKFVELIKGDKVASNIRGSMLYE